MKHSLVIRGEIYSEFLCDTHWTSVVEPPDWQTESWVPVLRKGTQWLRSSYRGTTVLSLPGMLCTQRTNAVVILVAEQWTDSFSTRDIEGWMDPV